MLCRVKVDLATCTLTSIKPLVVESFALSCSPDKVLLCHENSDIINSDFEALSVADVTAQQSTPLAALGLKRGSFIYAAWPEEQTHSEAPVASGVAEVSVGASESKAESDPVAFGIRNAAPVAGAQYVDPLVFACAADQHL